MTELQPPTGETPSIYRAADTASLRGQRLFLRATRFRLILLVIAAAAAVSIWEIGSVDVFALLSAIAFAAALSIELYTAITKPEQSWYEGRAAAESAKTLMWRYMVGGAALGLSDKADDTWAEKRLLQRFQEVANDLPRLHLAPVTGSAEQITEYMRRVRALSLDERRQYYIEGRLQNQIAWYSDRSRINRRYATIWIAPILGLELAGLTTAILRVSGLITIDIMGVISAIAAGCIAWGQAKQYQSLAAAYAVAHFELAAIKAGASAIATENEWKSYVAAAEDAISREHTMWRASRPFA